MKRLLSLLVLLLPVMAVACLNGFDGSLQEAAAEAKSIFPVPKGNPLAEEEPNYERWLGPSRELYEKGDYRGSVDYAVVLIYKGDYELAEKVCRATAKKWPNKYEAAANLGTVLELNGKNEEALKWIKKALEIDSLAHDGSEWIHVKVLEAKLGGKEAFVGNKLTGMDFGDDRLPSTAAGIPAIRRLQKELWYQLNERVTFVEPEDKYVAELMLELGNATLALGQNGKALEIYEIAQRYGSMGKLLDKRLAESKGAPRLPVIGDDGVVVEDSAAGRVGDGDESLYGPAEASPPSTVALVFMGLGLALVIGLFWRIFEGKAK